MKQTKREHCSECCCSTMHKVAVVEHLNGDRVTFYTCTDCGHIHQKRLPLCSRNPKPAKAGDRLGVTV